MSGLVLLRFNEYSYYILCILILFFMYKKKKYNSIFHFAAGFLFGIALELISVNLLGGYHYNPNYLINLGPTETLGSFPLCGGLIWGAWISVALLGAKKFKLNSIMTGLVAYAIVIGFDFMFDVIAVRIDGGMWVWDNVVVDYSISKDSFFGVNWRNFIGYIAILVPFTLVTDWTNKKFSLSGNIKKQILFVFINCILSLILFVIIISIRNKIIKIVPYFSMVTFITVFGSTIGYMIYKMTRKNMVYFKNFDPIFLITWIGFYIVCIISSFILGVATSQPLFFVVNMLLFILTMSIGVMSNKELYEGANFVKEERIENREKEEVKI